MKLTSGGRLPPSAFTAVLRACAPALSSPAVCEGLLHLIVRVCEIRPENALVFVHCGAVNTIVEAVEAHARTTPRIVVIGASALSLLVEANAVGADALLFSSALDALCEGLRAHPGDEEVQRRGCKALHTLAQHASPDGHAVMRKRGIPELLATAARNHPGTFWDGVKKHADEASAMLCADGVE